MAAILLLCGCSMMMSSSAGGAFFAAVIPGTAPHFEKTMYLKDQRKFIDMANELRLLGADLPTEAELADPEDPSVKNKLIQSFTKIQEMSREFCKMHTDFNMGKAEMRAEIKKHYEPGGKILTLGGMQLWSEYMNDYLKPTEDMIARYKARGVMKDCSSDSRDEGGNCVPFDSFNTAVRDNDESCENMKDMLEQTPEEIADQIIGEIRSRIS